MTIAGWEVVYYSKSCKGAVELESIVFTMGVDFVHCVLCGDSHHCDCVHDVYLIIPTEAERNDVNFDAFDKWYGIVPSLSVCERCIDRTESIVTFGARSRFFNSIRMVSLYLDKQLEKARVLMERMQYYQQSVCRACEKMFEAGEAVGVCSDCAESVHVLDCMVVDADDNDERCYERRVGITHGKCMGCVDDERWLAEENAKMEAADGEGSSGSTGSKKRKLE
jgi:hypothetical protein